MLATGADFSLIPGITSDVVNMADDAVAEHLEEPVVFGDFSEAI